MLLKKSASRTSVDSLSDRSFLNSIEDKLWATGSAFALELRTQFRGLTSRSGVLFQGPAGWGEFSPFPDYTDQRAALWLQAAIEAAYIPIAVPAGAVIPVNAIIGDNEDPREATRRALHDFGCTTVKVKLGARLEADLEILSAISSELQKAPDPHSARIRIDINGRWNLEQAVTALEAMREFPIEYVEQPCPDRESLIALRRKIDIPIAVDESIRIDRHESVHEFADIAILKVSPLGGLQSTVDLAAQLKMPVRISGALESSVGLFPSLVAAWELAPDQAAGVGTGALFANDLVTKTILPTDGVIPVAPIAPDPTLLERHAADVTLENYWRERFSTAFSLVPERVRALVHSELS